MKRKAVFLSVFIVFFFLTDVMAQPSGRRTTRQEYIEKYKDDAIREMHASGVPASITLAQGILESADGNSPLARYANNHFGIKCHGWEGPTFYQDDDARDECFRKYYSVYDSYKDHSEFLKTRQRYAFLFELKTTDYKGWAKGLSKAGYATNPKYADLLIRIIEDNQLHEYDQVRKIPSLTLEESEALVEAPQLKHREIKVHDNNIKYVIARSGDSYLGIANEFNMNIWQIKKYNDLNKGDELKSGDIIYLQPKRKKARIEYHTVKGGETMWDISQRYGIRLKQLYKKNDMIPGTNPNPGQRLYLRKKKV